MRTASPSMKVTGSIRYNCYSLINNVFYFLYMITREQRIFMTKARALKGHSSVKILNTVNWFLCTRTSDSLSLSSCFYTECFNEFYVFFFLKNIASLLYNKNLTNHVVETYCNIGGRVSVLVVSQAHLNHTYNHKVRYCLTFTR